VIRARKTAATIRRPGAGRPQPNCSNICLAVCAVLLIVPVGHADMIHFKNGTSVAVDRAIEKSGQVEYWVGSTKYVIPSSDVEKIEKSGELSIRVGGQAPPNVVAPSSVDATPGVSVSVTSPGASEPGSGMVVVPATPDNYTNGTNLEEAASRHFHLRYVGPQTTYAVESGVLETMERQFEKLSRELRYAPTQSLGVVLYTERDFFDITRATEWTSGLDHNQLHLPIQGISRMTPALQHVLKDEISYWFVGSVSRQRCPTWLNEGLAEIMEPRGPTPYDAFLAHMFEQHRQIPLSDLEHPFNGLTPTQAGIAYAESQATVEYLRDRYGMDDVLRILQRIGAGETPQAALRSVVHTDYAGLGQEVAAYLAKRHPQ
jgi:Peptidase MA superfamily